MTYLKKKESKNDCVMCLGQQWSLPSLIINMPQKNIIVLNRVICWEIQKNVSRKNLTNASSNKCFALLKTRLLFHDYSMEIAFLRNVSYY